MSIPSTTREQYRNILRPFKDMTTRAMKTLIESAGADKQNCLDAMMDLGIDPEYSVEACLGVAHTRLIADCALTTEELGALYNPGNNGQHFRYLRCNWQDDIRCGSTLMGYWNWVFVKLQRYKAESMKLRSFTVVHTKMPEGAPLMLGQIECSVTRATSEQEAREIVLGFGGGTRVLYVKEGTDPAQALKDFLA